MAKVKGSQVLGVVKALRGLRRVEPFDLPERLELYFSERLVVGAWYPDEDLCELMLLLGRILGGRVAGDPWLYIGRSGADRDFGGIYSALVRVGDPEWTLRHMPRGWSQFRDTGRVEVRLLEPGRAELSLEGYPLMCAEIAKINAGYFEGALVASGAKGTHAKVTSDETSAYIVLTWTR